MVNRAAVFLALLMVLPAGAALGERNLLWHVVQTCVATHRLTGLSFPCLTVDLSRGVDRGFAVVRAPLEDTHVVVTPTVHTVGVEAERLQQPDAPNYFADAWSARHFVTDDLPRQPDRNDLAMAVNSRPGRSQDQLHIHVDCVRQDVRRALAAHAEAIPVGTWTRMSVLPRAPRYYATALDAPNLDGENIFRLVRNGLKIGEDEMDQVTIVVVGATVEGKPGFVVLARQRIANSRDEAHGEALMDHACSAFR